MILLGLVGLYDPPREESRHAVRECHKAGIKVHMLTGDHPETASAIAKAVGIIPDNLAERAPEIAKTMVMTASQFDKLTDQEIDNLQSLPLVIARCAPNTKVRMIDGLTSTECICGNDWRWSERFTEFEESGCWNCDGLERQRCRERCLGDSFDG